MRSRLDGLLFVVIVLWLVTSALLVLFYQPQTELPRALQPQKHMPDTAATQQFDCPVKSAGSAQLSA